MMMCFGYMYFIINILKRDKISSIEQDLEYKMLRIYFFEFDVGAVRKISFDFFDFLIVFLIDYDVFVRFKFDIGLLIFINNIFFFRGGNVGDIVIQKVRYDIRILGVVFVVLLYIEEISKILG